MNRFGFILLAFFDQNPWTRLMDKLEYLSLAESIVINYAA
jgi:hypothetical protein